MKRRVEVVRVLLYVHSMIVVSFAELGLALFVVSITNLLYAPIEGVLESLPVKRRHCVTLMPVKVASSVLRQSSRVDASSTSSE